SEIIGKPTDSALGIKFVRDHYNSAQAMNITGRATPNEAYDALVSDPAYAPAIAQIPALHPAQLYEAFCYIFVFAILMYLYWKTDLHQKRGFIFGVFLVMLWTVRFVVEFVKESQGGFESALGLFSTGQWLSIPFILLGLYLMFIAERPIPGVEE